MTSSELSLGLLGLALALVPWGLDKLEVHLPAIIYWAIVGIGMLLLLAAIIIGMRGVFKPQADIEPMPIIEVEPITITNLAPGYRTRVTVEFTNRGTATAYGATSDVAIGILPYPLAQDFPMPAVSESHASSGLIPANGGHIQGFGTTDNPLTEQQVKAIEEGTSVRLYVAGTLSYRLASGKKCQRQFLMHTGGDDLMNALRSFVIDKKTKPPFFMADRFNDVTPGCE